MHFNYAAAAQCFLPLGINYATGHAPADLNGDGRLDTVVGHTEDYYGIMVAIGNGDGTFATQTYQTASDAFSSNSNATGEYFLLKGGFSYSNPLELSQNQNVTGLPVNDMLQLEAGFEFAIGASFAISINCNGYRIKPIFNE